MVYGMSDLATSFFSIPTRTDRLRHGEFWAVADISFEVKQGEAIGLIGTNGAGKSTMLKMINGIFMPDKGTITFKGKMGALIEVGAGFHPLLTGRENIYINGSILGMTKSDINRNLDAIIDFAGIDDFIDAPVKHYSSGMFVRLGFAIAAHCKPDILLIDEVLAVGDANFKRKCLNHLTSLRKEGVTFVIVSHNMQTIEGITSKAILFDHGKMTACGDPGSVIARYEIQSLTTGIPEPKLEKQSTDPNALDLVKTYHGYGTHEITVEKLIIYDSTKNPRKEFESEEPLTLQADIVSSVSAKAKLWVSFINENDVVCLGTYKTINLDKGPQQIEIRFDPIQLTTGRYKIAFHLLDESHINPFSTGHYGFFTVLKKGTVQLPGTNTPVCWINPDIRINPLTR